MPKPPVPPGLDDFLSRPNPSVIATLQPDGSPHTAATWYLWEGGRVLVNMDEGRTRLDYLRADPRVSITILGQDDWYYHVTLIGRVVSLEADTDLVDIDRLSNQYRGEDYHQRARGRFSAWIEVEQWHAWAAGKAWDGSNG
jgi:PPOX class probable F420-dependent enzyme